MQVSMERDLHISSLLDDGFNVGGEREKQKSLQISTHFLSQFSYCPAGPRKVSNYCYGHTMEGSHPWCLAGGKPTRSRIFRHEGAPKIPPGCLIFPAFSSMLKCLLPLLQPSFLPNLEFPCFLTSMLCSPPAWQYCWAPHNRGFDCLRASVMVMSPIACAQEWWGHIGCGSPPGACFLTLARFSGI